MPYDGNGDWYDDPGSGGPTNDWYNPVTGQVEQLANPEYHASPYEAAQTGGYGPQFDAYTQQLYANSTPSTQYDPNINLYDPSTWGTASPSAPTSSGGPSVSSGGGGGGGSAPRPQTSGGGGGGGGGGSNNPSFSFSGMPTEGFGAYPAPFEGGAYTTTPRPGYLQGQYQPQTWQGGDFQRPELPAYLQGEFTPPTMAEVQGSPGYQTRLDAGRLSRERSAAAQGSILSGGTQKALERYAQDYGANEYANMFAQRLQGRQQNFGEYQTGVGNAFAEYQQRYGQFSDSAGRDLSARGLNEGAYQGDVSNNLNQYNARYRQYQDEITNRRNAETDFWNRNQGLAQNGLTAAGLAVPR